MTSIFYAAVHDASAFLADQRGFMKANRIGTPGTHKQIKGVLRDHWSSLSP